MPYQVGKPINIHFEWWSEFAESISSDTCLLLLLFLNYSFLNFTVQHVIATAFNKFTFPALVSAILTQLLCTRNLSLLPSHLTDQPSECPLLIQTCLSKPATNLKFKKNQPFYLNRPMQLYVKISIPYAEFGVIIIVLWEPHYFKHCIVLKNFHACNRMIWTRYFRVCGYCSIYPSIHFFCVLTRRFPQLKSLLCNVFYHMKFIFESNSCWVMKVMIYWVQPYRGKPFKLVPTFSLNELHSHAISLTMPYLCSHIWKLRLICVHYPLCWAFKS